MNFLKRTTLLSLLLACSLQAQAVDIFSGNQSTQDITLAVGAPFFATYAGYKCLTSTGEASTASCVVAISASGTSTAEALTTIVLLKEEVQEVQIDAYGFLAGEEMTLALEMLLEDIRHQGGEILSQASDEELVQKIVLGMN